MERVRSWAKTAFPTIGSALQQTGGVLDEHRDDDDEVMYTLSAPNFAAQLAAAVDQAKKAGYVKPFLYL